MTYKPVMRNLLISKLEPHWLRAISGMGNSKYQGNPYMDATKEHTNADLMFRLFLGFV